jgi:hypothetical protein
MAIRPDVELAPNITAADASFPLGSSKDETAPGNNDGTPYKKVRADDQFGFDQALLKMAGITASGNPDSALDKKSSQYLQSILHAVLSASTFVDTGAADAYLLGVVGNNPAPANYSSNMDVNFIPTNTNTGASTVNIEGLGVVGIRLNGVALTGGELAAGVRTSMIYDSVNGWFELVFEAGKVVQSVNFQTGAYSSGVTSIPKDNTKPQNTEGDEYMTLAITPKATTNKLIIEIVVNGTVSDGSEWVAALFQDAVVDALCASGNQSGTANAMNQSAFRFHMLAGTVALTTFKVRAGRILASTFNFNGNSGGQLFNGTDISSINITEVQP